MCNYIQVLLRTPRFSFKGKFIPKITIFGEGEAVAAVCACQTRRSRFYQDLRARRFRRTILTHQRHKFPWLTGHWNPLSSKTYIHVAVGHLRTDDNKCYAGRWGRQQAIHTCRTIGPIGPRTEPWGTPERHTTLWSFSADGNELATLSNERPKPIKISTINAENSPGTLDQCRPRQMLPIMSSASNTVHWPPPAARRISFTTLTRAVSVEQPFLYAEYEVIAEKDLPKNNLWPSLTILWCVLLSFACFAV